MLGQFSKRLPQYGSLTRSQTLTSPSIIKQKKFIKLDNLLIPLLATSRIIDLNVNIQLKQKETEKDLCTLLYENHE